MELTRARRASSLAREDTSSSWTNGRKDCVSQPRGCHRGVFFQNLAKNSRIASCTCIDESFRENVSRSGQKFLAPAENIEEPTDFFIVAYHFVIPRVSILHKEIRFRARTFAFFTSIAFIGGPVFRRASARSFIYTQGHFSGYQGCGFSFSATCTRTPLHWMPFLMRPRAAG